MSGRRLGFAGLVLLALGSSVRASAQGTTTCGARFEIASTGTPAENDRLGKLLYLAQRLPGRDVREAATPDWRTRLGLWYGLWSQVEFGLKSGRDFYACWDGVSRTAGAANPKWQALADSISTLPYRLFSEKYKDNGVDETNIAAKCNADANKSACEKWLAYFVSAKAYSDALSGDLSSWLGRGKKKAEFECRNQRLFWEAVKASLPALSSGESTDENKFIAGWTWIQANVFAPLAVSTTSTWRDTVAPLFPKCGPLGTGCPVEVARDTPGAAESSSATPQSAPGLSVAEYALTKAAIDIGGLSAPTKEQVRPILRTVFGRWTDDAVDGVPAAGVLCPALSPSSFLALAIHDVGPRVVARSPRIIGRIASAALIAALKVAREAVDGLPATLPATPPGIPNPLGELLKPLFKDTVGGFLDALIHRGGDELIPQLVNFKTAILSSEFWSGCFIGFVRGFFVDGLAGIFTMIGPLWDLFGAALNAGAELLKRFNPLDLEAQLKNAEDAKAAVNWIVKTGVPAVKTLFAKTTEVAQNNDLVSLLKHLIERARGFARSVGWSIAESLVGTNGLLSQTQLAFDTTQFGETFGYVVGLASFFAISEILTAGVFGLLKSAVAAAKPLAAALRLGVIPRVVTLLRRAWRILEEAIAAVLKLPCKPAKVAGPGVQAVPCLIVGAVDDVVRKVEEVRKGTKPLVAETESFVGKFRRIVDDHLFAPATMGSPKDGLKGGHRLSDVLHGLQEFGGEFHEFNAATKTFRAVGRQSAGYPVPNVRGATAYGYKLYRPIAEIGDQTQKKQIRRLWQLSKELEELYKKSRTGGATSAELAKIKNVQVEIEQLRKVLLDLFYSDPKSLKIKVVFDSTEWPPDKLAEKGADLYALLLKAGKTEGTVLDETGAKWMVRFNKDNGTGTFYPCATIGTIEFCN